MKQKVILLHGFEEDALLALVRSIKAAIPGSEGIAFASTTAVNMEWKVGDLMEHVSEEHEAWKNSKLPSPTPGQEPSF